MNRGRELEPHGTRAIAETGQLSRALDSATSPIERRESPRRFTREVLTPSNVRALQLGAALVTAFAFVFALEITLELVEVFGG